MVRAAPDPEPRVSVAVSRGLAPTRAVLDNGVVFVGKETQTTPAVAINLAMRAGSAYDPIDAPGATWLLSRVIDRGTSARPASDIADDLDGRGISLAITVNRHLLSLVCTCLAEDFEPVLALLGEILISSSLPDAEIATRKREVITSIRQDEDNPFVRAAEALMALLYPDGHPYGRATKGSIDVVEALTRDRLAALHREGFAPSALTAVVVGHVDVERARDVAAHVFGEWRAPAPAPLRLADPVRPAARRRLVISMMNKTQADIAYGFTTIHRDDPGYYALWLANHVFGQYSIGGRLGDSIRERQGMAYYASSSLDVTPINAPLIIRAGVSPANVDRAIASIDEEVSRLVGDGVTPKELEDSRRYLIGSIPRALETNAAIATFLQQTEFFGLGLDYDVRLPALLGEVTVGEANAVARRVLDAGRATVVIAGPYVET
jgi:zinc protease